VGIVAGAAAAVADLLGPLAEQAARASGVIRRRRAFSAAALARTFVLGFLQRPAASDEHLAQVAAQCGAAVTPQAVEQRHTPRLVAFLEELFRLAVKRVVGAERALAPILERFPEVTLLDSTTVALPDAERERFPGCGGSHDACQAALKLQVELDLRRGALTHVEIEPGRTSDGGSARQHAARPAGSLRIADLGYFSVAVFAGLAAGGSHFLSRLHFKTGVRLPAGDRPLDLLGWLGRRPGPWIDAAIRLGPELLACRLVAWRLPSDQAARRRRKLREQLRRKSGSEPSAARLAWCDWTILVTSVPRDRLAPAEAAILYRARWQVELLFKRWKSQNLVGAPGGSTDLRRMARLWARLLAAVVQHWMVVTAVNGDPTRSWNKVAEAVRGFVGRFLAAGASRDAWAAILADLRRLVASTCRRNPRSKPGAFELLNDPSRLDFRLT
jgi:Transposase DDE domain